MSQPPPAFAALDTPLEPGTTLIEASAGTGKTHTITRLVLRLLLEGHVAELPRLLVVTYTNAATAELSGRVREAIARAARACAGGTVEDDDLMELGRRHGAAGARILSAALNRCDELAVTTIHGFCKRVLETAAFESGMPFAAEFTSDDLPLIEQAARDVWRARLYADEHLAVLAAARGWTVEDLVKAYDAWRRHDAVTILPPAAGLDAARAAVDRATAALLVQWDGPGLRTLLAAMVWNRDAPLGEGRLDGCLDAVARLAGGPDAAGLRATASLATEALHKAINKTRIRKPPDHPAFAACAGLQPLLDGLDHAWRVEALADLDQRFRRAKRNAQVLSFDDLLHRLRDALGDRQRGPALAAAVRARFSAALIDEFQDTDPVQCAIFTTLFARESQLVLVGDPKQAIYGFRGADLNTYLDAAAGARRRFQLGRNFRSSSAMVGAVNALFGGARRPFLAERIAFHAVEPASRADARPLVGDGGAALRWWLVGDGTPLSKEAVRERLLPGLAAEAGRLLAGGASIGGARLVPRDLAVLVRTNEQALAVQAALARAGIAAVVGGGGNVLDSPEADDLARVLAAIADPGDAPRLRGALASALWGLDAAAIAAVSADDRAWQALLERVEDWRERWRRHGLGGLVEHLLDGEGWSARLLAAPDGERRLTNLRHLRELLQAAEGEHHLAPAGLLAWLADARAHGRLERERVELRLESDADAVRILTVHTAKGREFPVVFCPFLWEAAGTRRPPVAATVAGQRVLAWPGAEAALRLAEADALGEGLRLAYVALTRAVHRCYVAWADTKDRGEHKGSAHSPLAYLLAQPDGPADGDDAVWGAQVRAHAATADCRAAIAALAAAHPTLMTVDALGSAAPGAIPAPAAPAGGGARQLVLAPGQLLGWRSTSFTGLSAGAEAAVRDHADPADAAMVLAPAGLHAFAAGARAGSCLHLWLEHLDWQQPVRAAPLAAALARFGLADGASHDDGADPLPVLLAAGEQLRTTVIPRLGARLADIAPGHRQAEWSFHLPLADLRAGDLAGLFARHGSGRLRDGYAPILARLGSRAVRGFLAGFVDLVVEHGGRWWILDWKSNRLGDDGAAYHDGSLWQAMVEHHYVLQQQLYLLALHRHLRARLPGYDPRRHLGGAVYVFLRGLAGGQPWYAEDADVALIEALDGALVAPALVEAP